MVALFTYSDDFDTQKNITSSARGPATIVLATLRPHKQLSALRAICRAQRAMHAWSRAARPPGTRLPLIMRAGRIAEVCCTVSVARRTQRATTKYTASARRVWRLALQRGRGRNRRRESASSSSSWGLLDPLLLPTRRKKSRARALLARG